MSGTVTLDGLTTTPQTVNENQWYSLADFLSYQPYESSPGLMPPGTTLLYAGGVFVDPSENLANNYWATGVANLTYPSSAYQETTYTDGTIYRYIYILTTQVFRSRRQASAFPRPPWIVLRLNSLRQASQQ
jgi:hypothetical protein